MRHVLVIAFLVLAVLASSCATPAQPTVAPTAAPANTVAPTATSVPVVTGIQLPEVNPLQVKGDIVTAGSSTVYPLSERMAERFADEGYTGKITIASIGSGAGLERFCKAGETDIANASRAIKSSEIESCRSIGREPLEIRIGTDALAIVVSKENTFIENVTKEELAKIFSAAAVKWSDVNPSWPNEDIKRFIPGTDSGTFDFFVEVILGNKKELALEAPNQQLSEDDNVLVQGVLGSPYAIGYFGYAYYAENTGKLKAVPIVEKAGKPGVLPSEATVINGTYQPLSRPIFVYINPKALDKPEVKEFVEFYMKNASKLTKEVKYVPLPAKAYTINMEHVDKKKKGTVFGGTAEVGITIEELQKREAKI